MNGSNVMQTAEVTIGALLHDIGKVLHRAGGLVDGRAHPISGETFIKQFTGNKEILDAIKFHHKADIRNAIIDECSSAYLVYIADNVASAIDRRDIENPEEVNLGYVKSTSLGSIFNLLNNHNGTKKLKLSGIEGLNFSTETASNDESSYNKYVQGVKDGLSAINFEGAYINSILELLEGYLSFVPSSTYQKQVVDISLFDHQKITAAIASSLKLYLDEQGCKSYKQELFIEEKAFYDKKAFLMFSCDISGIQQFIYTISSDNALKSLRSRSFYLEILLEHFIDNILSELDLSRANLIYSGGGHCYILLPNTEKAKDILERATQAINSWLLKKFKNKLYFASAFTECSCNELRNETPDNTKSIYSDIYKRLSTELKNKKLCRYSADDIKKLNEATNDMGGRECKVCGTVNSLVDNKNNTYCSTCNDLIDISSNLLNADELFVITKEKYSDNKSYISLPSYYGEDNYLSLANEEKVKKMSSEQPENVIRIYGKNRMHTGLKYAAKLWMGIYHTKNGNAIATFDELAKMSKGIERLAVLRADVDNLGEAFIRGFERENSNDKYRYVTLSRTATLSRQLSLFFKNYINDVLGGKAEIDYFSLTDKKVEKDKKVTIVYSGGDDIFLVGAWNEVIEAAVDLKNSFMRFSDGTLTFSVGIGLFPSGYPISRMAYETADLEDAAKKIDGKNSISIFGMENINDHVVARHTYKWDTFIDKVINEKLRLLQNYFSIKSDDDMAKGNSFLYKLLDYISKADDKINIARCAYLLGRMAPTERESAEQKALYSKFSSSIYKWILDKQDCKELITAIIIHVYVNRKNLKEENKNGSGKN